MVLTNACFNDVLLFVLIASIIQLCICADNDNGLIGAPEIQCNPDTIEMAFRTKRMFTGKVFVKGHYNNPDCRVDYRKKAEGGHPIGGIKLSHGQCDMDRQRMIQPEGMQFSTVLVISFHPLFITKTDRAFHIKCMYRETARTVSSNLEVSVIPTQSLEYHFPMPLCTYTIRKDEIDGPILKYARVGDQIVHRWECQSDMYGVLVHSCYVEDGQGEKELIVDEKGCHIDRTLLGDPTYVEALNMAYRESLVFKFADRVIPPLCLDADRRRTSERPTVNSVFAANSTEASNATDVTTANLKWRYARSANASRAKQTFDTDLISQSVYVLDSEDESTGKMDGTTALFRDSAASREVCVSATIFTVLLSGLLILFVVITAVALWMFLKSYR
ncbi:Cuticlin-1 [Toxocara canis]|uniref:Cuticlin-1 n=1 Tax=Toxocara canis TaxID=6265 RepID=A0A0B2VVZ1_TOXCA|nr:Cuticlin-1 [Toxocara canis]